MSKASQKKKSKALEDIRFEFANIECAAAFALSLDVNFPGCRYLAESNVIRVWASKPMLLPICEMSENKVYCRRKLMAFTPF